MFNRLKTLFSPLFFATVITPTLVALAYFGALANDVYISESRFVVRSPSDKEASPLSAVLGQTGLSGSFVEGNDAITAYVQSRSALGEANKDGFVSNAYSGEDVFFVDRFGSFGDATEEELYQYFGGKLNLAEGTSGQVMTLRVSAFDPAQAQTINARLLTQSEELANSLSERAQEDSIKVARREVDEATKRARDAAIELAKFRESEGIVDPELESQVGLQMLSKLQDQLIASRTQLRQLKTYTPEASQIPFLQSQIRSLQSEIDSAQKTLAGGSGSLSSAMVRYQELRVTSEFAAQQLAVALASLQDALADARRKRAYIERISNPSLPDYPEEPRRIRGILATFVLGMLTWGVLSMLLIGVREHRD
ncbi:MAG: hypothetical protein AAGH57_02720 [Pseudomonadota bacterium]